jgi:para-aminobenzoate synthetase component 1
VEKVCNHIVEGDIYQANLSQRFEADLPGHFSAWEMYKRLRKTNPAPFGVFLQCRDHTIASSSPERFLSVCGSVVEARPIKGTIRRDLDNPSIDAERGQDLLKSEKDRAENIMIVDLLRNDLSKVCTPDSVKVPALCELETYASVHHLTSVVMGELRQGMDAFDLITAAFPGGSITGAPKIRAMEIITELEGDAREIFCGSIGWIGFNGDMDFNIAIRTAFMNNKTAVLQAGGGITILSEAQAEYDETLAKAARVFDAFAPEG